MENTKNKSAQKKQKCVEKTKVCRKTKSKNSHNFIPVPPPISLKFHKSYLHSKKV